MSRKISEFFQKKSIESGLKEVKVKEEEAKSSENLTPKNENKIIENVKTEVEQQLLVILPKQKIQKLSKSIKIEQIEEIEPNVDNHQCHICNNFFKSAKTLKIHKLIHNKTFHCEICNKNYPTNAILKKHIKNVHKNPGSFKCQVCSKGFSTKANLDVHQRLHNPDRPKPFKCGKCEFATDHKATFQGHLKTHDRIIERCGKCSTILQKDRTHDCSLDCKFCGKKFRQRRKVTEHIMKYHAHETDKEYFECDICGLKVNRKLMLQYHMEAKHADGRIQVFTCDLDGKTFKIKNKIVQHMKIHLPIIKCDFCDAKFKIRNLKRHLKNHHTGIEYPKKKQTRKQGRFECPICFKVSTTKSILKRHINSHNKTIKCQFCERMFGCQMRLNEHFKNYHENPEGNKCTVCGKKFTRISHLERHMIIHGKNRQRNFKCTLCGFATFEQKGLESHLNFHKQKEVKNAAMKNPHKCPKCPSVFDREAYLVSHLKGVHPEVLVECDICGVKMKRKSHLLRHIRNVHKIKFEGVQK